MCGNDIVDIGVSVGIVDLDFIKRLGVYLCVYFV